jgi:ligand-binding sensor domain-containing protein
VWFADGFGASVFDGSRWHAHAGAFYDPDEEVTFTPCNAASDGSGGIWYALWNGLRVWQDNAWRWQTVEDGAEYPFVVDIAAGLDGSMWMTSSVGVTRYDGSSWTPYSYEDGLPKDASDKVAVGADGSVWTHSLSDAVCRLDGDQWSCAPTPAAPRVGSSVEELVVDGEGRAWLCRISDLVQFVPAPPLYLPVAWHGEPSE